MPQGVHLSAHSMLLQDTFSNNARLSKTGTLSYYVMHGLSAGNLTYPDGMSKDYAFQSVLADLGESAETRVTVDGLTNGLDCVPAELAMTGARPANPHYSDATLNVTVESANCGMKALRLASPAWRGQYGNSSNVLFARFAKVQCDDTDDYEGSRALLLFGNLTYTVDYTRNTTDYTGHPDHPVVAKLHQSTQLLCVPNYTITRVEVVRNGTETKSVRAVPGAANRTLESIHPWAIMDAHYSSVRKSSCSLVPILAFRGASPSLFSSPRLLSGHAGHRLLPQPAFPLLWSWETDALRHSTRTLQRTTTLHTGMRPTSRTSR